MPWAKYSVVSAMLFYNLWSWNNLVKLNISPLSQSWPAFDAQYHECTGFGWDKVAFLPKSSYGAVFWMCEQNSVDNRGMVQLLLENAYTA